MNPPEFVYRPTTVAIVAKESGELLAYEMLSGRRTPFDLITDFMEAFEKGVVKQMKKGEERTFLLFSRVEGLRPDVREVVVINKKRTVERSVMGSSWPGSVETFPYTTKWEDARVLKKGEFPRAPDTTSEEPVDDLGLDEEAIRAAAIAACALMRAAAQSSFSEESRSALLDGLKNLMISTGTDGEPFEFWHMSHGSIEETAVDVYDAAICLWLESDAADTLPENLKLGYQERTENDEERTFQITRMARHLAVHDLMD